MRDKAEAYPDWKAPTPKEKSLNKVLLEKTSGPVHRLLTEILSDSEINLYHSYANAVSVRRLGYNDHGPVHARITTYNALKILALLHEGGIPTSLESEEVGTYQDSQVAVALGCFLHDIGMSVARADHEWHSVQLGDGIIQRYLQMLFPDDPARRAVLRAMAHEVIVGHMGHSRIHSVEAGIVLVADGTDMSRGRSRIPMNMDRDPVVGDMHRFSAGSITRVDIGPGSTKPVRIAINMNDMTGLFQVEEVLMGKVKMSPIITHLEISALVAGHPPRHYLH